MDTFQGGMSRHSIIANAVSTVIPNTTLLLHRGQGNDFVISAVEAPYRRDHSRVQPWEDPFVALRRSSVREAMHEADLKHDHDQGRNSALLREVRGTGEGMAGATCPDPSTSALQALS